MGPPNLAALDALFQLHEFVALAHASADRLGDPSVPGYSPGALVDGRFKPPVVEPRQHDAEHRAEEEAE